MSLIRRLIRRARLRHLALRRRVKVLEARVDSLEETVYEPEPEQPIKEYIAGVDAYWRTGNIDWVKVRQAGYRFAILKATEGVDYLTGDKRDWFIANARAAKGAGMLVSFYHFGRPDTGPSVEQDAREEAEDFLKAVEMAGGPTPGCPLWLDLEKDVYNRTRAEVQEWITVFLSVVDAAYPCGLYVSNRWMEKWALDSQEFSLLPDGTRRGSWVARYGQNLGDQWIDSPPDWVDQYDPEEKVPAGFVLDIHQYGSKVPVPGYPSPGDANISPGQVWADWGVDPKLLAP